MEIKDILKKLIPIQLEEVIELVQEMNQTDSDDIYTQEGIWQQLTDMGLAYEEIEQLTNTNLRTLKKAIKELQ